MNTNLVIAITIVSIFGACLLLLGTYFLHGYLSIRRLERDYWFSGCAWTRSCAHCYESGCYHDAEKGRRQRAQSGMSTGRRRWYGYDCGHGERRGPAVVVVPGSRQVSVEGYVPQGWMGQRGAGEGGYGQSAMYPREYQQHAVPRVLVVPTSPPPNQQVQFQPAARGPMPPLNGYLCRNRDVPTRSQSRACQTTVKSDEDRPSKVRKVDFIHVVDEYPPIVQDAIDKAKGKDKSKTKSCLKTSQVASNSNVSTESVEEVPRASIPQGGPAYENGGSSHGDHQNVYIETQTWATRTQ